MHTVLILMLVACGASSTEPTAGTEGAAAAAAPGAGTRSDVALDEFVEAHGQGAVVLDVRTEGEFAAGHVPGATNKPLGSFGPDDPWLAGLDKEAPLYVICHSGGRSARAADTLAAAGFNAVNVLGGTGGWQAAGHPVEK